MSGPNAGADLGASEEFYSYSEDGVVDAVGGCGGEEAGAAAAGQDGNFGKQSDGDFDGGPEYEYSDDDLTASRDSSR